MKPLTPRVLIPAGAALVLVILLIGLLQLRGNTSSHPRAILATATTITDATTSTATSLTPLPTATSDASQGKPPDKTPTPTTAHPTATPLPPKTPTPNHAPAAMKISPAQAQVTCGTPTQVGVYPAITITNSGGGQLNWTFLTAVARQGFNTNYMVQVSSTSGTLGAGQSQVVRVTQIGTANTLSVFNPHIRPGPAGIDLEFFDNSTDYSNFNPLIVTDYCTNLS